MYIFNQLKRNFSYLLFLGFQTSEKYIPTVEEDNKNNEQQTGIEKSDEQQKLEEKLETIEASLKYLGGYGKSLDKGTKKLAENVEDSEDKKEIQNLQEKLSRLKEQYKDFFKDGKLIRAELDELKNGVEDLQKGIDKVEYEKGIESTGEEIELSFDDLKTITNHEFLKINPENRLQYITKNHVDSESISNGIVNNVEFTFTFNGKYNEELYRETTAGQVLPKEVREVTFSGQKYQRAGLNGEFYNGNDRLVIREGTKIDISKLGTEKELSSIKEINNQKLDKFISENPNYINYREKLEFILNEGIDAKYIKIIGLDNISNFDEIKLEKFTTNIAREKEYFDLLDKNNKLPKNLEDFEKILLISKKLRNGFAQDANLTETEKLNLAKDTEKMSIMDVARYIEQKDDILGRTNVDYDNLDSNSIFTGKIEMRKKGLTPRMTRLKDIVPNAHVDLNDSYNKYTLDKVPESKRQDVKDILLTIKNTIGDSSDLKGWEKVVCRNAINNSSFSSKKPFIAQNLSYKTALIYFPGQDKVDLVGVNHGSGVNGIGEVSNVNGSHGTSLGSKRLVAQGGGKYQFRLVVEGLEPIRKKMKISRSEAMNHDPAEFGNANDKSRVVRIHETKLNRMTTWGCSGLDPVEAKKLYLATKKSGGASQEIFVSKV